jgi:hypothetical protein
MKRAQFGEVRIITILKQAEGGNARSKARSQSDVDAKLEDGSVNVPGRTASSSTS